MRARAIELCPDPRGTVRAPRGRLAKQNVFGLQVAVQDAHLGEADHAHSDVNFTNLDLSSQRMVPGALANVLLTSTGSSAKSLRVRIRAAALSPRLIIVQELSAPL